VLLGTGTRPESAECPGLQHWISLEPWISRVAAS
jgi:hypothetical protein